MDRHDPSLPPERRLLSLILGLVTTAVLAGSFWQLGNAEVPTTTTEAVPTTTTTTATTTPSMSTESTQVPTTVPTTTTTTATTFETTTTDPPTTSPAPVTLEADGLGIVDFGASPVEVIEAVRLRLGPPTADSGWVSSQGRFGTCPGNVVRVVRWQSLRLYFSDGPTTFGADERHFFYFVQSPAEAEVVIDLRTSGGVGLGTSVAELREVYGEDLVVESTVGFGATFYVDGDGPGLLSGLLNESVNTGQVTSISGGFGCGA